MTDWPADEPLFDDADGEFPPLDQCRHLLRRGRWMTVEDGPSIDTYEDGQQAGRPDAAARNNHLVHNERPEDTSSPDGNQPQPPRPNRATRRALARANRQKGHRR